MASKRKVNLNEYDLTTTLGTGSFGRVMLCKSKKSGDYYAMKRLKKADIIKLRQVDHVISENTILADIDHPFLVSVNQNFIFGNVAIHLLFTNFLQSQTNTYQFFSRHLGWPERFRARLTLPLLLNGLHSWWRAVYVSTHGGQVGSRACNGLFVVGVPYVRVLAFKKYHLQRFETGKHTH
jgi:hypothetical protein